MTSTTTTARAAALPANERLRLVLRADAAASAVLGAAGAAGSGLLDGPLGIPRGWLLALGVLLLPWAVLLLEVAGIGARARRPVPVRLARVVAAGNAAWVAGSLAVLAVWPLTALGVALVLAQAAAVAGFAAVQLLLARS